MTIGQRIAQKRKELALSQEALGEQLGVSRQAIYKWESDGTLPEIDKLIALAKLFGVSVGWLLGVEEEAPAPEVTAPETTSPPPPQSDLSETQLRMVQEIVEQYLAAQPKPKTRRRWPLVLAVLVLLVVGSRLFNRLERLNDQYNQLQSSVGGITHSVNTQINGISSRVEEILKAQNDLTAEYGTEVKAMDFPANQITFSVHATPKTFVEGMRASVAIDNGTDMTKMSPEMTFDRQFSAEISHALTNDITLSVTFIYPDGTQQTQLLDTYEYLYSGSMPSASVQVHRLMFAAAPGGHLELPEHAVTVFLESTAKALGENAVSVTDVQVGLFLNRELLLWAKPATDQPTDPYPYATDLLYEFPPLDLQLTEDDELCVAAVLTDNFGRQIIAHDIPYIWDPEDGHITHPTYSEMDSDPANWDFE